MTKPNEIPRDPVSHFFVNFPERRRRAISAAHRLTDDQLAANDAAVLVRSILDQHAEEEILPVFEGKWNTQREITRPGTQESNDPPEILLEFHVPCYGTIAALHEVDSRCTHGSGSIQPRPPADQPQNSVRIQFTYSLDSSAHIDAFESGLMQTWEKWQDALKINVRDANTIIRKRRAELANDIRPLIEARQRRVIALRTASANLAIPLSPNLAPSVSIPLKANLLTLERIEQQADSGTPEPALANNLADDVLNIILGFTNALERLHTTADRLAGADEETLRDVLLFVLNANFTGIATGETFTGKGKTDILLRWRDRNAFIAECKFWTGTKKFVEAIDQLLGYTVWRDTRIALILFVRDRRDVSAIITKAVKAILQHPQIISGDEVGEIDNQREFILASTSDSKRAIRLAFIPVHLPTLRSGQTLDEITTP